MSARAERRSPSKDDTPARAEKGTSTIAVSPARASTAATSEMPPPARADVLDTIRNLGGLLDDMERVRIANGNRIAALEREYGSALPHLHVIQKQLATVEHLAELELKRAWRKHPLAPWAAGVPGVGEKLIARLIAVIGDPAERENPAKLWAYCGFGEPLRKRRAGMSQAELFRCGSPHAKKRAWLIGAQFVRTMGSPYRGLYDEARERYADRDWTDGHKHAAAIRFVTKRFLLELWKEARAGHIGDDAHATHARAGLTGTDDQPGYARAGVA